LQKIVKWYKETKEFVEDNKRKHEEQKQNNDLEEQSKEDSEDDGIFGEGDEWFPEEI